MKIPAPKRVIVESATAESAMVASLRKNLPEASFEIVDRISDMTSRDPEILEVVDFRGKFLKSCPGTRHYHCCGYRILHFGAQCSLDCSYCILQAYLNQPNLRLFGNLDDLFRELSEVLAQEKRSLHRIGTGEFTDSLLLDPFTELSRLLVPYFARTPNAVLELKTKTTFVENLRGLDHAGHTIVAWSLNSQEVRKREEPFAATIAQRLKAARSCSGEGYFSGLPFRPHYRLSRLAIRLRPDTRSTLLRCRPGPNCLDKPGGFTLHARTEVNYQNAPSFEPDCLRRVHSRTGWQDALLSRHKGRILFFHG